MRVFLLLLCFLAAPAQAAKLQEEGDANGPQTVTIPLVGIEGTHHMDENLTMTNQDQGALELRVSSWQPNDLELNAFNPNLTGFTNLAVPQLGISYFSTLSHLWKIEVGFALLALKRTGSLNVSGQTISLEQDAYIPQARVAGEYFPFAQVRTLRPYLELAILPTMVLTKRSAVDDGTSDFGMAFDAGAGTLVVLSKVISLDVNLSETVGKASNSNLAGFSVAGGVRINL